MFFYENNGVIHAEALQAGATGRGSGPMMATTTVPDSMDLDGAVIPSVIPPNGRKLERLEVRP